MVFFVGVDWRRNALSYQDLVDSMGLAADIFYPPSYKSTPFYFLAGKKTEIRAWSGVFISKS
jgi:hypothetical protein